VTRGRWPADRRRIVAAVLLVLALGAALAAVVEVPLMPSRTGDNDEAERAVNPSARLTIKNGVVILTLNPADQQNAGIQTAHLSPAPAQASVLGYGTVLDPASLTDLSNRYLDAETSLQTATARLAVSRAAFERAKLLHKDQQNISTAQLQGAEGSFEVDKAALAAARSRLAMLAASARQAWGSVLGEALIDRAQLVTRLIERRDYLVKVTLPAGATIAAPPEAATTRINDRVEIRLALVSPATATDPKLQGISYLYSAAAESGLLPGMNLQILLAAGPVAGGVVVPEAAVVWLQGKAWTYLRTGATTFVRREIAPNRPGPGGGYVVADLPVDEQIVVRGAQTLLSEEFRAQVPVED
jgi:hypothetical protein